jgi:hypothetical protein
MMRLILTTSLRNLAQRSLALVAPATDDIPDPTYFLFALLFTFE